MRQALLATFSLVVGLTACGSGPASYKLIGGSRAPAAEGVVTTKVGPNGNTDVMVTVKHLAEPSRVEPGATVYVVWVRDARPEARPINVGALTLDAELTGTLQTITPLRDFELSICAESVPTVDSPAGEPVLSTRVSRK